MAWSSYCVKEKIKAHSTTPSSLKDLPGDRSMAVFNHIEENAFTVPTSLFSVGSQAAVAVQSFPLRINQVDTTLRAV